jgi:hypothetical protein
VFPWWDHLFETYSQAPHANGIAIGIDDPVYNRYPWHREMLYSLDSVAREIGMQARGASPRRPAGERLPLG